MADNPELKTQKLIKYGNEKFGLSETTLRGVLDKAVTGEYNAETVELEDGTAKLVLKSATAGEKENLFAKLVDRTITEVKASDLEGVTMIADYAFYNCYNLVNVAIPESVTDLKSYSFRFCTKLSNIIIPANVTRLGSYSFNGCSALNSVVIECSNPTLGSYCFSGCSSLTSFSIPSDMTVIPSGLFSRSGLTDIVVPSKIVQIDGNAFQNCEALPEMTLLPTTPPTLSSTNAISTATTKIYVPYGSLAAYKTATNWSTLDVDNGGAVTYIELNEDGTKPDITDVSVQG